MISTLSSLLGVPEAGLILLFVLLSGFPFALVYRALIACGVGRPAVLHVFSVCTGLWMVHCMTGTFALHFMLDIGLVYVFLITWQGSRLTVTLTWITCGVHLLVGYAQQCIDGSVHNPLNWTIPQCVLLLKLIGVSTDLYDGTKKKELDYKQNPNAINRIPSLLELMGFCCFFGGILVGPQFSFTRYVSFTSGTLYDVKKTPNSIVPGLKRFITGLSYVSVYAVFAPQFPTEYLISSEYADLSFVYKVVYLLIWGRIYLLMYVGVWILTEGACIASGISYDGYGKDGTVQWGALANVHALKFELSYTLQGVVDSFNVSTNRWTRQYVFSRLKWLRFKPLSHLLTLVFLASWHGLWPGYYITFLLEFVLILQERQLFSCLKSWTGLSINNLPWLLYVPTIGVAVLLKSMANYFALACFFLLRWEECWKFMKAVNFYLFIAMAVWAVFYAAIVRPTKQHKKQTRESPRLQSKSHTEVDRGHLASLSSKASNFSVTNTILLSEE